MTHAEIIDEIDLKYGEVLEMVPPSQIDSFMLSILINMLVESRNLNEYYKKVIQAQERK